MEVEREATINSLEWKSRTEKVSVVESVVVTFSTTVDAKKAYPKLVHRV